MLPDRVQEGSASAGPESGAALEPSELERILARGRWRGALYMLGPAFVAAVAYVDPGNFATNVQSGSQFGFLLLWVVALANVMAMLVQYLSAKLGIVTDRDLAGVVGERAPGWLSWLMWAQAELVCMATDVAEFLGAAVGLNLLFGVPLLPAGLITVLIAFAVLELRRHGVRAFELAVTAMLGVVLLGFLYETLRIGPSVTGVAGGLVPHLRGPSSLYLAVGIIGATVMPHVIYLHSALTNGRTACRHDDERSKVLRFERIDVMVALGLAGAVNMAMLAVAAQLFHARGLTGVESLAGAHAGFGRLAGGGAALVFAAALLASGASSSSVGTYAGEVVMAGFIRRSINVHLRRLVTMAPAVVLIAAGVAPTSALVLSQVVLSFGVPFALVPLIVLTSRRDLMGPHVNRPATTAAAVVTAGVIISLNVFLVVQATGAA